MKHTLIFFLVTASMVFLTACPVPHELAPFGTMNATIDGHNWTASVFNTSDYNTNGRREFDIMAYNNSNKRFNINFYNLKNTGSYPVRDLVDPTDTSSGATIMYTSDYNSDNVDSAAINVVSITAKNVSGNFSCITHSGVVISSCTFNVSHD